MEKSIIISLLLLSLPQLGTAHSGKSFSGMPHQMMSMSSGWMGWWWIMMLVFWVLVIGAIIAFSFQLFQGDKNERSSKETLKQRFAKGEIDKKEFKKKLEHLNKK